jgi:hypothetical protein
VYADFCPTIDQRPILCSIRAEQPQYDVYDQKQFKGNYTILEPWPCMSTKIFRACCSLPSFSIVDGKEVIPRRSTVLNAMLKGTSRKKNSDSILMHVSQAARI